jgi:mutator protein MutT
VTPQIHKQVVAAVVERDQKVLVCLRPALKQHGGCWEFPGGKIHDGETIAHAIARELHEELAIVTTEVGEVLFSTVDEKSGFEILFVPASVTGSPVALEHDEIAWCLPAELSQYPLAPSDKLFAAFLQGVAND